MSSAEVRFGMKMLMIDFKSVELRVNLVQDQLGLRGGNQSRLKHAAQRMSPNLCYLRKVNQLKKHPYPSVSEIDFTVLTSV